MGRLRDWADEIRAMRKAARDQIKPVWMSAHGVDELREALLRLDALEQWARTLPAGWRTGRPRRAYLAEIGQYRELAQEELAELLRRERLTVIPDGFPSPPPQLTTSGGK